MCWSRSTDTMHLLPHFIKKDVIKGGPVEEMRVRLLLQNIGSANSQ